MDCRWLAYQDDQLLCQSVVGIIRRESQIDVAGWRFCQIVYLFQDLRSDIMAWNVILCLKFIRGDPPTRV